MSEWVSPDRLSSGQTQSDERTDRVSGGCRSRERVDRRAALGFKRSRESEARKSGPVFDLAQEVAPWMACNTNRIFGEVSEWLKEHAWKVCMG